MLLRECCVLLVPIGLTHGASELFVVDVAQALQEEQREDEALVFTGINRASKKGRSTPEIRLELGLADAFAHLMPISARSSLRRSSAAHASFSAIFNAAVASATVGICSSLTFET